MVKWVQSIKGQCSLSPRVPFFLGRDGHTEELLGPRRSMGFYHYTYAREQTYLFNNVKLAKKARYER